MTNKCRKQTCVYSVVWFSIDHKRVSKNQSLISCKSVSLTTLYKFVIKNEIVAENKSCVQNFMNSEFDNV